MDEASVKVDIKKLHHFLAAEVINPEVRCYNVMLLIDKQNPIFINFFRILFSVENKIL